jgi:hypothetical protein
MVGNVTVIFFTGGRNQSLEAEDEEPLRCSFNLLNKHRFEKMEHTDQWYELLHICEKNFSPISKNGR